MAAVSFQNGEIMPQGKVERIEREKGFTQIDNGLLTDETIGLEGIGLLSHILHYSKTFEIYKSQLQRTWGRALVERAWDKSSQSGYIIAFKNYSTNNAKDSYSYTFDEYKFSGIDLMDYFEEMWAKGYLFYAKSLYQVSNRNLKTIEASFPRFLFPNEEDSESKKERLNQLRKELAQFVFERLPKPNEAPVPDFPTQVFEESHSAEQAVQEAGLDDYTPTSEEQQAQSSCKDEFVEVFPQYIPELKRLESKRLTESEMEEIIEILFDTAVSLDLEHLGAEKTVQVFKELFDRQMTDNQFNCKFGWVQYFKKGFQQRLKDYILTGGQNLKL